MYQFEKLEVRKRAMDLIEIIYQKAVKKLPREERYELTSQLKRAVTSIALNIAEGRGASSDREFKRFLEMSLRSLYETVAILKIAERLQYLTQTELLPIIKHCDQLGARLRSFIKKLKANGQ